MRSQKNLGYRADLADNSFVLLEYVQQLVVVVLELLFLQKNNAGTFRNGDSHSLKTLTLAYQLEDLVIEVDVELLVLRITDDKCRLKAGLRLLDLLTPSLLV